MFDVKSIPLGTLCEVKAGPSGSLLHDMSETPDGVPVISPPDLSEERTVDTRRLRRVPDAARKRLERFALRGGDVLVVRQGGLGRLGLIQPEQAGWFFSSSCLRVRSHPDAGILPGYLASYLSLPRARGWLLDNALPGTVPSINSKTLMELPVDVPPLTLQREIIAALADVDEQISVHRRSAELLSSLRPSIFDELVKGGRADEEADR
ncbi:restriction endonuclease subunit S [Streptomyces sp. NPDC006368]|uniref:restriction endonuclease subunit S n=1 Tax=Streptomyces sp. NPDC006368 TaxID=3156760 RepID=UPI0033B4251F